MGEARTGGEAALSGVTAELDAALRHAAAQAPGSAAFAELLDSLHVHVGAGKLIRPRLVELGWRLATADPVPPSGRAAVDRLGAAFELLHTALLVHDDVIDRDVLRRGQPAVHASARHRLEARGVPAADAATPGSPSPSSRGTSCSPRRSGSPPPVPPTPPGPPRPPPSSSTPPP